MEEVPTVGFNYHFDCSEYLVFGVTLLMSAMIGVYFGFIKGGQDTITDYLFGGKNMSVLPITMSLIASFISGTTLLGVPAEIYNYGSQYILAFLPLIGYWIGMKFIFLPVIFKLQLISLYEYFERRFSYKVRLMTSLIYTLALLTYIPIVIYGPALALNQVSGLSIRLIAPILCAVCIFYTAIGGLKGVVWADTLQGMIMIFSVLVVLFMGTLKVGGFSSVFQKAYEGGRLYFFNADPDPTLRMSVWSISFGLTFHLWSEIGMSPSFAQRFTSLPTKAHAQRAVFYFCCGGTIILFLCCGIGLVIYAYYKDCDPYSTKAVHQPDQILAHFVVEVARDIKGLPGLFLAGVVSAALSTMSTCLNTVAGTIYEDFIEPSLTKEITEARASQIMRLLVVIFGSVCASLVLLIENLGTILELNFSIGGMTFGAILGLFFLGTFFPRANNKGAICGSLFSISIMAWILIGSKMNASQGLLKNDKLPVTVEGCSSNFTESMILNSTTLITEKSAVFLVYRISGFYYSFIGCLIVIIVGTVVSYLTGFNKVTDIDPDLLSPLIKRYITADSTYTDVPLNELEQTKLNKISQKYV